MRPATPRLPLTDSQRAVLQKLARSGTAAHREVQRARVLVMAADGEPNTAIAATVGVAPATVKSWRERFAEEGLKGLGGVKPGRGRKPQISQEKVAEIVRTTLKDKPEGETHWSCRTMAAAQGVSPATVQRVWSARGLRPHRVNPLCQARVRRFSPESY